MTAVVKWLMLNLKIMKIIEKIKKAATPMSEEEKIEWAYNYLKESEQKPSFLGLIASFLIPIVGVMCYFAQRDRLQCPNGYLHAAFFGFILSIISLTIYF